VKVRVVTVSHKQPDWVVEACLDYVRRLPREWGFQLAEVKPEPRATSATAERVRTAEAERIRVAVQKGARLVALDERGETWSTAAFAARFARWQHEGRDVAFVVGGADGLAPDLLAAADVRMSLSPLTLPHGLVRVVLVEQLYRVASLLQGHPYHR
jgi:23S rRNA (pseudouridine1915-N3)-methyltransferase